MYKTFTLPLKWLPLKWGAFSLSALFILTACGGGFTIDLNVPSKNSECFTNPFLTECDNQPNINAIRRSVINDCTNNPEKASSPLCLDAHAATNPRQVTAAVWVDSFDEPLTHAPTAESTKSKFLIARATDLDDGGLPLNSANLGHEDIGHHENLNLADATFNGVPLGGDRADGVAFFATGITYGEKNGFGIYSYAGVLSGTNLGAPLTQTSGTAQWDGSFTFGRRGTNDFVLNISFGTGNGVGEIDAIFLRTHLYGDKSSYSLQGEFDDSGVITGTTMWIALGEPGRSAIESGGSDRSSGILTGLIGEEGAVGAILVGAHFAGFVARPSDVCLANPFGPTCADSDYNDARKELVQTCAVQAVAGEVTSTCNTIITEARPCLINPFDTVCDANPAVRSHIGLLRSSRVVLCESNLGSLDDWVAPLCTGVPTKTTNQVTTADWVASFSSPLSDSSTRVGNHFVTTTAAGLNERHLRDIFGSDPYVYTLNFADATFKGRAFGGDATDGVVIFRGRDNRATGGPRYSNTTHYAGILPGTNLGAPVNEPDGTAIWYGQFRARGHATANSDFALHINFGDGDGAGTLHAAVIEEAGDQYYRINGRFDDNGVITGTSEFADGYHGVLTGLIGEEGAVGVFVSDTLYYGGYVGGFVASPTRPDLSLADTTPNRVTTADWLASFETKPLEVADINRNQFLQIAGADLNFSRPISTTYGHSFSNISEYSLNFKDDVFRDGGGDRADGVVFYRAHNGDESNSYFYAGVIPTTILGAPLSETSGKATWVGRLGAAFADGNRGAFLSDFTLGITFNGKGGDISTDVIIKGGDYFELDGTFNDRGVISGTANHVRYENGRIGDVTGDIVNSGPLTGLIGQEGAVGAFISNRQTNNTSGFAGGFVARPPSQ